MITDTILLLLTPELYSVRVPYYFPHCSHVSVLVLLCTVFVKNLFKKQDNLSLVIMISFILVFCVVSSDI